MVLVDAPPVRQDGDPSHHRHRYAELGQRCPHAPLRHLSLHGHGPKFSASTTGRHGLPRTQGGDMSGGSWNYAYHKVLGMAEELGEA